MLALMVTYAAVVFETPDTVAARILDELGVPPIEAAEAVQVHFQGGSGRVLAERLATLLRGRGVRASATALQHPHPGLEGFEWQLSVKVKNETPLSLEASWKRVDRGLWRAPEPEPWSRITLRFDRFRKEDERLGKPVRLFTWPSFVWALGRCWGRWILVDEHRLSVKDAESTRSVELSTLEPAEYPVRAPWATVVCSEEKDQFAFGHGRLKSGWVVSPNSRASISALSGHPVGHCRGDWFTVGIEKRPNINSVNSGDRQIELTESVRKVAWSCQARWAVDQKDQLRSVSETGVLGPSMGPVGRGLDARFEQVASTGWKGQQSEDGLALLLDGHMSEVSVPGWVSAVVLIEDGVVFSSWNGEYTDIWQIKFRRSAR